MCAVTCRWGRRTGELPDRPSAVASSATIAILREIGRGGMGIVYLALQKSLQRLVAVKVLPPHLSLSERQVERFRREAFAAARLRHPTIVPIYTVGDEDGMHFIVMGYVRGKSLAQELGQPARAPQGFARARSVRAPRRARGSRLSRAGGGDRRAPWRRRSTTPTARASSTATSSRRTS
jgi:hypothetical protein